MDSKNAAVVVLLLLATVWIDESQSCSCMPVHPQTVFCHGSSFALMGKVESVDKAADIYGVATFTVTVMYAFKSPDDDEMYAGDTVQLLSYDDESMCGVSLQQGEDYMLTGYSAEDGHYLGLCGWNEKVADLTTAMQAGIFGAYDCSCYIQQHFFRGNSNDSLDPADFCDTLGQNNFCVNKHAVCLRGDSDACEWRFDGHDGCVDDDTKRKRMISNWLHSLKKN